MKPRQNQINKFETLINKECEFAGVPVNIREIKYSNELLNDGTAYVQDITVNNKIDQYMLDSGGNFWYNYACIGPEF